VGSSMVMLNIKCLVLKVIFIRSRVKERSFSSDNYTKYRDDHDEN
jgi:hypothetical protein